MTLRLAYAAGLWGTTTLAMLAVLLGGEMPITGWAALTVPALAAWRLAGGRRPGHPVTGTVLAVGGLAAAVGIVVARGIGASLLASGVGLLGALAGRLYGRAGLGHDLQALLLSLLLVIAGAGLHTQITYGLVFVAFAVAAAWTLAARQLWVAAEREAAREGGAPVAVTLARRDVVTPRFFAATAATAVLVLALTSAIFVLFPRVGLGSFAFLSRERRGLPEGVILSSRPRALGGGDVVARVSGLDADSFAAGLYLRVAVYEQLTVAGFSRVTTRPPARLPLAPAGALVTYDVFLQPLAERGLAALGPLREVEVLAGASTASLLRPVPAIYAIEGTASLAAPLTSPARYRVRGALATATRADRYLQAGDRAAATAGEEVDARLTPYLDLPRALDPRIPALVARVVGDARTPADKASRLRRYLTGSFGYSLEQTNSAKADPLAGFLFEDPRGHCEFFATAFATLLRASGVPARVVGGFAGGVWDDDDEVAIFTAATAHAWTEWYQPGAGWVTDDATPVGRGASQTLVGLAAILERLSRAWDDNVLEFGLDRQLALLQRAADTFGEGRTSRPWRPPLVIVAQVGGAGLLLGAAAVVLRRRRTRRGNAERLGCALGLACEPWLGRPVYAWETLRAAVRGARSDAPAAAGAVLHAALGRYERSRFGGEPLGGRELRALLASLRRSTRRGAAEAVQSARPAATAVSGPRRRPPRAAGRG